ncbi:MAG: hypothetical protein JWO31_321, partial [Phycisphaerales bacterium]|nr:hypothetical protein [Phycisphaerales bacterium]
MLPNLPALKEAAAQYTQATRRADGQLVGAYEAAIGAYTDAQRLDDAMALRKERQALLSGAGDAASATTPEAIALLLERAKGDYQQQVADAKAGYVNAVAARVKAATRQGDLPLVTALQAAKAAVEADRPLPPGFADAGVARATARYGSAVQADNLRLAQAFREAVRGMTRAGHIDRAQEIQAEFDATGLNVPGGRGTATVGGGGGGGTEAASKLSRTLPSFLAADGTYATEKDGIRPARGCVVGTKAADFLSKDFVFDVTLVVPKAEGRDESAVIGLGDGTEKGSLRVLVRQDGGWGKRAFLALGDEWGKHFGDVRGGETYVVRVRRADGPVTVSVGQVVDGQFVADSSQTVGDAAAAVPGLSGKRAKLFFSGGVLFT